MRYKKPVLIELFAECFLAPSSLNAGRLVEIVTVLKGNGFSDVELLGSLQMNVEEPTMIPRIRCWSQGRNKLVQLSQDCLIINLVGEYPGWPTFNELMEMALGAVHKTIGSLPFKSISLNTIDRFSVPKASYALESYVSVGGQIVPQWYKGSKESLDITLGWGMLQEDNWNRQINVKVRSRELVTIEFRVSLHRVVPTPGDWKSVLNALHEQSNQTFEALITDKTRNEVMEGVVA